MASSFPIIAARPPSNYFGACFYPEGAVVDVLEDDDGSGWVKVADGSGGKGLIPASYIEAFDHDAGATASRSSTPTGAPTPQGSGQYGK